MTKKILLIFFMMISIIPYANSDDINSNGNNNLIVGGDKTTNIELMTIEKVTGSVSVKNTIVLTKQEYFDKSKYNVWLTNVTPEEVSYTNIENYISEKNRVPNKNWRLPTLEELHNFRNKNIGLLKNFSDLEVWAAPLNGRPALYDIEFGDKLSGHQFSKKNRYILLVRNAL